MPAGSPSEVAADVCVIGGGPAGSTAAALLATAGRSVALFEKEFFPRFHIGESLLPYNMDLLRRLGILDRVAERFVEKLGAHLVSSDGAVTRDIVFAEAFVPGHPKAYQVLRSSFDELLLRNAADRGARVYEGHAVTEAIHSHRDGCAVTAHGRDGGTIRCRARCLLGASGRDGFVATRGGCRRIAGDGYLLLGDAAAFIDPLFSTGVWLAMSSAEIAADTLDRALGRAGSREDLSPAVFAAYERKVRRHVRIYTRIVSRFYQ